MDEKKKPLFTEEEIKELLGSLKLNEDDKNEIKENNTTNKSSEEAHILSEKEIEQLLEGEKKQFLKKGAEINCFGHDYISINSSDIDESNVVTLTDEEVQERLKRYSEQKKLRQEELKEGKYKNGKEDGEWKYYYENGQVEYKVNYKEGVIDGESCWYYPNGKIKDRINYKDGKFDGEWICYYANGNIKYIDNYKCGVRQGECVKNYDDGKIKCKSNYIDDKQDGKEIDYFKSGQIASIKNYKNEELNGEWIDFFVNGQIESKGNYKDGQVNGDHIRYYENGQIESKGNYKDGQVNGGYIRYYENGKIRIKRCYKDGIQIGEEIEYYESGKLKSKSKHENGKIVGAEYYENGQIKAEGFSKGEGSEIELKIIGYFENGNLQSKKIFNASDGIDEYVEYYDNGQIKSKGSYANGKRINYYANGSLDRIVNFENEFPCGEVIYYKDNQVLAKGYFKARAVDGDWLFFKEGKLNFKIIFSEGVYVSSTINKKYIKDFFQEIERDCNDSSLLDIKARIFAKEMELEEILECNKKGDIRYYRERGGEEYKVEIIENKSDVNNERYNLKILEITKPREFSTASEGEIFECSCPLGECNNLWTLTGYSKSR